MQNLLCLKLSNCIYSHLNEKSRYSNRTVTAKLNALVNAVALRSVFWLLKKYRSGALFSHLQFFITTGYSTALDDPRFISCNNTQYKWSPHKLWKHSAHISIVSKICKSFHYEYSTIVHVYSVSYKSLLWK